LFSKEQQPEEKNTYLLNIEQSGNMSKPKHIGIIIDGNRRYAKKKGLLGYKGHSFGVKKVEQLIDWCNEHKIKELTLYTLSTNNLNRSKIEVKFLMSLLKQYLDKSLKEAKEKKPKTQVKFIGNLNMFDDEIKKLMIDLMVITRRARGLKVNFAVAYDGRQEIINAVRNIAKKVRYKNFPIKRINEKMFAKELYLNSYPDLIIRTSETRLSGFLLWQASYSELIFLPKKLWPDFTKQNFVNCIHEYQQRNRKYGR